MWSRTWWLTGMVALLLSTLAQTGRAEELSLSRVERLHEELDYAAVIATGRRLLAAGGNDAATLRRIYELLGGALVVIGDEPGAAAAFRRLLALRPSYQVGEDVSPKIRKLLAETITAWAGRPGLTVVHRPPARAPCERPLRLEVQIVEDPERMVDRVRLTYRLPGAAAAKTIDARIAGRVILLSLPAAGRPGDLRYSLDVLDGARNVLLRLGVPAALSVALHRPAPPPRLTVGAWLDPAVELERELAASRLKRRSRTRWGYAALGAGLASAVTAAILYGVGVTQGNAAHERYLAARTDAEILREGESVDAARHTLTAGHVLLGVGVAAVAASVYLLLTRPSLARAAPGRAAPGRAVTAPLLLGLRF